MNECKILGFARYTSKEDQTEKIRVNIAIPYEEKGYTGLLPLKTIFLSYSSSLEEILYNAIKSGKSLKIDYNMKLASQKVEIIGFSEIKTNESTEEYIKITDEDYM